MGFGGNTSCIEIRTDTNEILIFDGGTGIRLLGKELEQEFGSKPIRAHIFFSHFHLDHIQGIPFFRPLYNPRNHFTFYFAGRRDANLVMDALAGMMANPYFPVDMSKLPCSREYVDLMEGTFDVADTSNSGPAPEPSAGMRRLSHHAKRKGDFLLHGCGTRNGLERSRTSDTWRKDADFFIVDSQYTPEELPDHVGWGHSSWKQAIDMGIEAGVKQIALYHHDPYHEDAAVEEILQNARKYSSQRDRRPRRP